MQVQGVNIATNQPPQSQGLKLWDGELPSFNDVIDAINPLQHIPIVSKLYQDATGDTMGAVANIGVATLFGGIVGGAIALANEIVDAVTGDSVTGHIVSAVLPDQNKTVDVALSTPPEAAALEPAAGGEPATETPKRAVSTKDWIYGNFGTNVIA